MTAMGEPIPSKRPASQRYRVLALEPDDRLRTRMTLELAGIAATPVASVDEIATTFGDGGPTVLLLGASMADAAGLDTMQRLTRAFPELGVVLLTEEVTLSLLHEALRAGVRDVVTIDAGESQIRQAIERVGDAMTAMVKRAADAADTQELGKVIVAFSTKGGVGKSVVATNTSIVLATREAGTGCARRLRPAVRRRRRPARHSAGAHDDGRGRRHGHGRRAAHGRAARDARGVGPARALRAGRAIGG